MAITKEVILNKIEMVGTQRTAQLQYITVIKEDGAIISRSIHRRAVDCGRIDNDDNWIDNCIQLYENKSLNCGVIGSKPHTTDKLYCNLVALLDGCILTNLNKYVLYVLSKTTLLEPSTKLTVELELASIFLIKNIFCVDVTPVTVPVRA